MRHNGFSILLAALAAGWMAPCAWSAEADGPSDTAPKDDAKTEPAVTRIYIGSGPYFRYSAPEVGGWGADIYAMREYLRKSDRAEFLLEPESDLDVLKRLVAYFAEAHGPWHEVVMQPLDPSRYAHRLHATLSLPKETFREGEPIPLTIRTEADPAAEQGQFVDHTAPWWLFSVTQLLIQNQDGREVNPFIYPVSGGSGGVRSKVFYDLEKKTIDLTAFVEPYHGQEYVFRFKPGMYRVTFYLHSDWDQSRTESGFIGPRWLGSRTSNTVTFTVKAAPPDKRPDLKVLLARAEELIDQNKPNEAVRAYKRAILHTRDQATIQKAIRQIVLIRSCASYDSPPDFSRFLRKPTDEGALSLGECMRRVVENEKECANPWLHRQTVELSLLHVPPEDRKAWVERYLNVIDLVKGPWDAWTVEPEDREEVELWRRVQLDHLFACPQYKPILDEAVRHPERCDPFFIGVYLREQRDKDPAILRTFLEREPQRVFEHYVHRRAPLELVPFIPRYFEGKHARYAMAAFIRAVGLDLEFDPRPASLSDKPAMSENVVKAFLQDWWRCYAPDFGVTLNTEEADILGRIAAIRQADQVLEGYVEKAEHKEGHLLLDFYTRRRVRGFPGNPHDLHVPAGFDVPKSAFDRDNRTFVCVTCGRNETRLVDSPHAIWIVLKQEKSAPTRNER